MRELPDTGAVIVTVASVAGRPGRARVECTRRIQPSALLLGRKAGPELSQLLSILYMLCPAAQSCAWETASELAMTGSLDPEKRAARAAAIQLEAMGEHMRCFALELPKSLGIDETQDMRPLGALRAKSRFATLLDEKAREKLLAEARDATRGLLFGETTPLPSLEERLSADEVEERISELRTVLRPVLAYLLSLPDELGRCSEARLETSREAVRLELTEALKNPDFCLRPRLFSGPVQTSALARRCHARALLPRLLKNGANSFDYFYARFLELGHWCRGFEDPARLVSGFSPEPDVGVSFVETARGTLIHRARIERGVVREAAIVAPTEWNFLPGGPAEEALSSIRSDNWASWQARASIVVRQFDACIPFRIRTEASNA